MQTFYGKYRAKVVDVKDPEKRGRIKVLCPKVLGDSRSAWCEPCIPVAYDYGGDFAIPKVGEFVWVEFEEGNSNKPVYTGGLWSTNKSPSSAYNTSSRLLTWGGCTITMTDSQLKLSVGNSVLTLSGSGNITYNGRTLARIGDDILCSNNLEGKITGSND